MKNKIKTDLLNNNKTGAKTRENYISKHYPSDYIKIHDIGFVNNWNEKLYCYINELTDVPTCVNPDCNNKVHFNTYSKGYYQYCSILCRNRDSKLKLNDDKNPMKNIENIKKAKKTKKDRYGDENYVNSIKAKKTKKDRYGDENFNNREKFKITTFNLYGKAGFTNREKAIETNIERYGVEHYNNREKAIETNIERYGVEHYNNREKAIETCIERYGVKHHTQSENYKKNKYLSTINIWGKKLNLNNIDYNGNEFTVRNLCPIHHEFVINKYVLRNRLNYGIENICTKCNPIYTHDSIKEKELVDFIKILNIKHIENDRKVLDGKEIDIYLPNNKLGIEFNGLYYHSNIYIDKNYHRDKTELSENCNIQLLHVFENEWINSKEIVKSIIKSKIGIIENRIYGRKTNIKEIRDNKLVKEFLETNHIQGFVGSKIKLGLFYGNELVSLMTFGKKRIAMGNKSSGEGEYEMLRFCNKLNTQVIGGASKLLKYFLKNYNPKLITTYADRRYSNGELYKTLGFTHVTNTQPNYWYFKSHEYVLHHRFKFRKDVLVREGFDAQKTEHQIMSERGYMRIYDCGNMKFELKLE